MGWILTAFLVRGSNIHVFDGDFVWAKSMGGTNVDKSITFRDVSRAKD